MSTTSRRFGKYELQSLLGQGGMAEVWRAFDTQLHRYVAIKLLHANLQADPDFVNRFTREARVIAALRHPNIVQIYDFHISENGTAGLSETDTVAYMVMEYIQGSTLANYIHNTSRKKQFPSAAEIVRLFTPISLAIDYAHQQGMIHRDIKPSNILLDQTQTTRNAMGEPILSDFGLAKVLSGSTQTHTEATLGTPLYISPEQAQNRAVTKQTDLYALAVIFYEIFTGKPPFQGDSLTGIMMQHLLDTPVAPHLVNPDLPPALSEVILKGLAKEPQNRFSSASAMTAAIASAFDIPVPEDLKRAISTTGNMGPVGEQTILSQSSQELLPSSSSSETIRPSSSASEVSLAVPPSAETVLSEQPVRSTLPPIKAEAVSGPVNLPDSEARLNAQAERAADLARQSVAPVTPPPPIPTPPLRKSLRLRIALVVILICVLVGGGLSAFFLLAHHNTPSPSTVGANIIVGQAFFVSSGQLNMTTNQGSNDEFQINLQHIPAPASGNSYYAWLLPDKSQVEGAPLLLGRVPVTNGAIHFTYTGDSQHTNLLATMSQFAITEESSSITPSIPSPDLNAWRYYAALPQTPAPGQTYSLLDHLRHLLAIDPTLETFQLHGGLDIWTYRNMQSILQWAGDARDAWNAKNFTLTHQKVVAILDYLDGSKFVNQDVPPGTPILADPQIAQIGLLQLQAEQEPPGYLYHIALHLNGVLASPGATQNQRTLAVQINNGVNNVTGWLGQMRQDAIQVVRMSNDQLALASTLSKLNDMLTLANNAYMGLTNPATGQQQIGVTQIYRDVQLLATFDVKPYK